MYVYIPRYIGKKIQLLIIIITVGYYLNTIVWNVTKKAA